MRPEPDLAGFREASVTLREKFGQDVPFFSPTTTSYPPGTSLDPESGQPFDPTIQPTASGFASAVVRVGVVFRPMGLSRRGVEDDIKETAIGNLEEGTVVLISDPADYEAHLTDATECIVQDERYTLTQVEHDRMGNGPYHRVLLYAEQM